MLAVWIVSLRRTHDAKRHIFFVRPCASVLVNEFNPQGLKSFTIKIIGRGGERNEQKGCCYWWS